MYIDQDKVTILQLNESIDNMKVEVQAAVSRQLKAQQQTAQHMARELSVVSS